MRNRMIAVGLCLTAIATRFVESTASAEPSQRPNIVFMYADDWRWDCLGVVQREEGEKARFPRLETPRLDKLAQDSLRFNQSFVVNSLCSPGRTCALTSRYSHLNGIVGNSQPLPIETLTFAKQLKKAGYTNARCESKCHLPQYATTPRLLGGEKTVMRRRRDLPMLAQYRRLACDVGEGRWP